MTDDISIEVDPKYEEQVNQMRSQIPKPGKLKDGLLCPICEKPVSAVMRRWGGITFFDYLHDTAPFPVHTTAMPFEYAKMQVRNEEDARLIEVVGPEVLKQ